MRRRKRHEPLRQTHLPHLLLRFPIMLHRRILPHPPLPFHQLELYDAQLVYSGMRDERVQIRWDGEREPMFLRQRDFEWRADAGEWELSDGLSRRFESEVWGQLVVECLSRWREWHDYHNDHHHHHFDFDLGDGHFYWRVDFTGMLQRQHLPNPHGDQHDNLLPHLRVLPKLLSHSRI